MIRIETEEGGDFLNISLLTDIKQMINIMTDLKKFIFSNRDFVVG